MIVVDIKSITIVGAGNMGSGIAQCASQSGFSVYLSDLSDELIQKGMDSIKKTLEKGVELGKVTEEQSKKTLSEQKFSNEKIGQLLIKQGYAIEEQVYAGLAGMVAAGDKKMDVFFVDREFW